MTTVPNSFSQEDLEALLKNAVSEEDVTSEISDDPNDISEERIIPLACKIVDDTYQHCSGPILHKAILLTILDRLIEFHKTIGDNCIKDGELENGTAWHRDAGQLQVCAMTIQSIVCSPDDFMAEDS